MQNEREKLCGTVYPLPSEGPACSMNGVGPGFKMTAWECMFQCTTYFSSTGTVYELLGPGGLWPEKKFFSTRGLIQDLREQNIAWWDEASTKSCWHLEFMKGVIPKIEILFLILHHLELPLVISICAKWVQKPAPAQFLFTLKPHHTF